MTGKPEDAATKSEFLDIKNPSNTCKLPLPDFRRKLSHAVGGFTKFGPLICSGCYDKCYAIDKTRDCYRLTRDRQYQKYQNKISTARYEASSIGNVQTLIDFMTVFYTRWRFDNYTKKGEFYIEKKTHEKIRETLFTFKLHSAELLSF